MAWRFCNNHHEELELISEVVGAAMVMIMVLVVAVVLLGAMVLAAQVLVVIHSGSCTLHHSLVKYYSLFYTEHLYMVFYS